MNKHFLKTIQDNMPVPLKYVTSGLIRNKLIKNNDFLEFYFFLKERKKFSPKFIEKYEVVGKLLMSSRGKSSMFYNTIKNNELVF